MYNVFMDNFVIKNITNDLKTELETIGFDKTYLNKAMDKYEYKNFKIFNLSLPQANILKQTAISVGADCAVHKEVITAKVDKTDCILGGSISQLKKICQKLKQQPFKLVELSKTIEEKLENKFETITIKEKTFDFKRPYIVGVLNLTNDSFSDGGLYFEYESAIKKFNELLEQGADIIELGAESTKPNSKAITAEAQLEKLIPILNYIKENNIQIPISIDTRSAEVAEKCINAGADIINDVSGFDFDPQMPQIIAKTNAFIIIQHSSGTPETMQKNTNYDNLIDDIYLSLDAKINLAIQSQIGKEKIIIDPGVGFGKTKKQSREIIKKADDFLSLGVPVMIGVSRKSFLGLNEASNEEKDIFSLAINSSLIDKKINFLRVHNVSLTKKLIDIKIFE